MKKSAAKKETHKVIATNRRAFGKFRIIETLEAGMVLTGPEVKSLRAGNANLSDGYIVVNNDEAYMWNVHISPYSHGSDHVDQEPTRRRKILLHRREILKWMGRSSAKGLTVVPLEIYFNKRGKAKLKIGLAKGKTGGDRREDLKRKTVDREIRRDFAGQKRIK